MKPDYQDIDQLRKALAEFYGIEQIETWLKTPHPGLGHCTPLGRLAENRGIEVWTLIDQLRSGAFV